MADRNSGSGEVEMSSDGREQELQPIVVGLPTVGARESAAEVKRKRGRPARSGQVKAAPPSKKQKEDEDVCLICFDGGSLVLCDRRMGSEHLGKVLSKLWTCAGLSPKYLNKTLPELARVSADGIVVFSGYPGQRRAKVAELSKFGRPVELRFVSSDNFLYQFQRLTI
ncbi:hypothetical protein POM88_020685 [Heracleum sosnowskyi]|uniref:Uncharacterized protein n=1 Tax=Heracleum sosnowskyi TaxID=360622 RepID=A0AAD8MNB8_9APIA|nr:hypothetical protein POM88_020685 [Heracleum sosnowskyi]